MALPEGNVIHLDVTLTPGQIPVVDYIRTSDSSLNSGLSVERQIDACALVRAPNISDVIVARYLDDESGTVDDRERPGLRQMLVDAMAGRFRKIYIAETSRAARASSAIERMFDVCRPRGIEIITADAGRLDPVLASIKVILAREEIRTFKTRVKGGKKAHWLRNHQVYPCPSVYSVITDWDEVARKPRNRVTVRPELRPHILWMFQSVASGMSFWKVGEGLSARGVNPPRASRWSPSTLLGMIENPIFKGERAMGRTELVFDPLGGTKDLVPLPDHEWIIQDVEPYVSEELWRAANEKRSEVRAANPRKAGAHERLWTGRLQCPCGATLTCGNDQRRVKHGLSPTYWICWRGASPKRDDHPGCLGATRIMDDDLRRGMKNAISHFLLDENAAVEFERLQEKAVIEAERQLKQDLSGAKQRLAKIKSDKLKAYDRLFETDDPDEQAHLTKKRASLKAEEAELTRLLKFTESNRSFKIDRTRLASYASSIADVIDGAPGDLKTLPMSNEEDSDRAAAIYRFKSLFEAVVRREPRSPEFSLEILSNLHRVVDGPDIPVGSRYVYDTKTGAAGLEPNIEGDRPTAYAVVIRHEEKITFQRKGPIQGQKYPSMCCPGKGKKSALAPHSDWIMKVVANYPRIEMEHLKAQISSEFGLDVSRESLRRFIRKNLEISCANSSA